MEDYEMIKDENKMFRKYLKSIGYSLLAINNIANNGLKPNTRKVHYRVTEEGDIGQEIDSFENLMDANLCAKEYKDEFNITTSVHNGEGTVVNTYTYEEKN